MPKRAVVGDVIEIIFRFYDLRESWGIHGDSLTLSDYNRCVEWAYEDRDGQGAYYDQQTAFGNILIPAASLYHDRSTVKVTWIMEYCRYKDATRPFYVGVTNHSSFKNSSPQITHVVNPHSHQFFYGYRFEVDDNFTLKSHHYRTVGGNDLTKERYQESYNAQNDLLYFSGNNNAYEFGEIAFSVLFDGFYIGTDIRLYKHPESFKTGVHFIDDNHWERHYQQLDKFGFCFLCVSIPVGTSIGVKEILTEDAPVYLMRDPNNPHNQPQFPSKNVFT